MTEHKGTGMVCAVYHGEGVPPCRWCSECDPPGYVQQGEHDDDEYVCGYESTLRLGRWWHRAVELVRSVLRPDV